ncbi:hypothetical protein P3T24_004384 [Paraburkholderia sp. GAS33]|uniref:hypothetical protein n=1 Tax=Paraburkholderia sp. GAS33 TaxID=3035130 RepID=UPI003D1C5AA9
MNAMNQTAMGNSAPAPRITLDGEIQSLYDALINLGGQIDRLEQTLHPVIHQSPPDEKQNGQVYAVVPPAIQSLRGLRDSVEAYVARISDISNRVAL